LLAVLAGHTPESLQLRGGSLRSLKVPGVQAGLPVALMLQRPDIAAAEWRLSSQQANVRAARAAFLPTITLTGSLGLQSVTLKNLLRPDAVAASLAEGLTAPIFSGGNLEGQLQQAEGRQIEALEIYRKAILTALSDVENALVAVEQTTSRERLQGNVVEASRRAYLITEERLREGTIDIVTLLNTQLTYFQAQDLLVQVRLQRFQAVVSLFQALGGGWTREDVAVILSDPMVPPQTVTR
jgi:NodT family efflux transporter outer membrane factor (OMF) lipoprotein